MVAKADNNESIECDWWSIPNKLLHFIPPKKETVFAQLESVLAIRKYSFK